jgi:hypothetical protein
VALLAASRQRFFQKVVANGNSVCYRTSKFTSNPDGCPPATCLERTDPSPQANKGLAISITTFSLPIDIPWTRIAFSSDMMDKTACDRELPLRWRSSIAIFEYEPPIDQQRSDDFLVTYLKVSCTVTGYQEDGKEIRIRERLGRSGWTKQDLTDKLGEMVSKYYPCHGAILEVVVAPAEDGYALSDYPYFADFDPKKRELYEAVTDTGEVMSRSLEDVNVRRGQTTLQSHEVKDKTTLSAGTSASYMGFTGTGSATNESGTTDVNQQGSENVRTTDALRESREQFTHMTQLSQMYHQLDSYHLGTNRAAFFILPRPHTVQAPTTFVNGPREIEGVQEFMLVVVRPKTMEEFCVEAYLETAHLTGKPIYDDHPTTLQLPLRVDASNKWTRTTVVSSTTKLADYVIDTSQGPQGVPLNGVPHGDTGGYQVNWVNENGQPREEHPPGERGLLSDYSFIVNKDTVTVTGWAVADGYGRGKNEQTWPTSLELSATVYLKKAVPSLISHESGLMITGRAVCSCGVRREAIAEAAKGPSLVYEKELPNREARQRRDDASMTIRDANQLGADLKREMVQSLSSPDRYPRGTVGLLDSQLVAGIMAANIRQSNRETDTRLLEWPGVDRDLARRVTAYAPAVTRSVLLGMPLARQVEDFGLTFAEAVALRRTLADLAAPSGPPPVPERSQIAVPLLTGLQSFAAQSALSAAGLGLGSTTVVDSPLTSGSVIAQDPLAGVKVEPATEVSVQVASGCSVRLPEVLGLRLSEASCRLHQAGLRSEPSVEGRPGPESEVVALDPPPGTLVTPKTPVTMTLKRRSKGGHADPG